MALMGSSVHVKSVSCTQSIARYNRRSQNRYFGTCIGGVLYMDRLNTTKGRPIDNQETNVLGFHSQAKPPRVSCEDMHATRTAAVLLIFRLTRAPFPRCPWKQTRRSCSPWTSCSRSCPTLKPGSRSSPAAHRGCSQPGS